MNNSTSFSIKNSKELRDDVYPDVLYLDTCFIIELEDKYSNYYQTECLEFFSEATERGTIFVTSEFTHDEIYHVVRDAHIKYYADNSSSISKDDKDRYDDSEVILTHPEITSEIDLEADRIYDNMEKNEIIMIENTDNSETQLLKRALSYLYGLDSYDAKHVSTILQHEFNSMATLDSGFLLVDDLNIFGPTKPIKEHSESSDDTLITFDENLPTRLIDNYLDKTEVE